MRKGVMQSYRDTAEEESLISVPLLLLKLNSSEDDDVSDASDGPGEFSGGGSSAKKSLLTN